MRGCVLQKTSLKMMYSGCSQTLRNISVLPSLFTKRNNEIHLAKDIKRGYIANQSNYQVLTKCHQKRMFSSGGTSGDDDDHSDLEDESIDELFLDDNEYRRMVQDSIDICHGGHRVFVMQPVDIQGDNRPTTAELQLEESIGLVKSVADWKVVGSEIFTIGGQSKKNNYVLRKTQMKKLTEQLQSIGNVSALFISVDYLTREQLKRLQKDLGIPVLDRYSVVIQIFREHAKTQEAKLQVSVAEVSFLRSRITEIHEGRATTANTEVLGGTGETFLQARKIILRRREKKLRRELEELKQQRNKLRKNRLKRQIPSIAVIGYTNSGKTTLIKALTGDERMVPEDRLFATLDVTVHAGYLPNTMKALFVDTVGFISNIPAGLMKAFSATLEDAILADLVVHVQDMSNPDWPLQRENVMTTVKTMLSEKQFNTMIHVGNKIDKLDTSNMDKESETMYVSAETGLGLDVLREEVQMRLLENTGFLQKKIRIPLNGDHFRYLYKEATVVSTEEDESGENLIVNIVISADNYEKFKHRYGKRSRKAPSLY